MITSIVAGLGAIALLVFVGGLGLLLVGGIAYMVFRRSKAKGVVFKDGVSNDEGKMIAEAISEVLREEQTKEVLKKYVSMGQKALAKVTSKTPPVVGS